MLIPHIGHKNIVWPKAHGLFGAIQPILHLNRAIEYDETLGPVIDVPDLGLIGPVQPHRGGLNFGEITGTPSTGSGNAAVVLIDVGLESILAQKRKPYLPADFAIGAMNCGSESQGNRIQVSWLTSVMKVSTIGLPAGLA